ncbi:MAG: hypothetical protein ACE5JU_19780 [Candidatus Binatia bacterium]
MGKLGKNAAPNTTGATVGYGAERRRAVDWMCPGDRRGRKRLDLKHKQKLIVLEKGGIIHLVPDRPLAGLRGVLRGMRLRNLKDERDRF